MELTDCVRWGVLTACTCEARMAMKTHRSNSLQSVNHEKNDSIRDVGRAGAMLVHRIILLHAVEPPAALPLHCPAHFGSAPLLRVTSTAWLSDLKPKRHAFSLWFVFKPHKTFRLLSFKHLINNDEPLSQKSKTTFWLFPWSCEHLSKCRTYSGRGFACAHGRGEMRQFHSTEVSVEVPEVPTQIFK